jgi:hypothetical protein
MQYLNPVLGFGETVLQCRMLSLVKKYILLLSLSWRAIAKCYLGIGPIVWGWDTLGANKQAALTAQGVLGHLAMLSGWEMARRDGDREKGLMWSHRPWPPWKKRVPLPEAQAEAKHQVCGWLSIGSPGSAFWLHMLNVGRVRAQCPDLLIYKIPTASLSPFCSSSPQKASLSGRAWKHWDPTWDLSAADTQDWGPRVQTLRITKFNSFLFTTGKWNAGQDL